MVIYLSSLERIGDSARRARRTCGDSSGCYPPRLAEFSHLGSGSCSAIRAPHHRTTAGTTSTPCSTSWHLCRAPHCLCTSKAKRASTQRSLRRSVCSVLRLGSTARPAGRNQKQIPGSAMLRSVESRLLPCHSEDRSDEDSAFAVKNGRSRFLSRHGGIGMTGRGTFMSIGGRRAHVTTRNGISS